MDDAGFDSEDFSVEMGDYEVKRVRKFDRVWRMGDGGSISCSPVVHGGKIYFGCADRNVYSITLQGKLSWKFRTGGVIIQDTSAVCDGMIFVGSFDHCMYALDAETGNIAWKFAASDKIASNPTPDDGLLYFGSKDHNVYAVDMKTGQLAWKFRTFDCVLSQATVWRDRVMVGSYDHFLYCLEKKTGRLLWKHETQGELHGSNPFGVRNGIVYFGSFDNYLRAVDIQTGNLVWKTKCGSYGMGCAPVISGDRLLQQTRDGILFCLDMEGNILWKFSAGEDVQGPPMVNNGMIYFCSFDHNMYCLDMHGKEQWRFRTQDRAYSSPAIHEGVIYIPSYDCHLYAVDLKTRMLLWKFRTSGGPSPMPPAYEAFEVGFKVEEPTGEDKRRSYDIDMGLDGESGADAYKSRVTYRMSSQYAARGRYQKDADTEGL